MKYLILLCILVGSTCAAVDDWIAQDVNSPIRIRRQAQRQAYQPPPEQPAGNYRPLNQAPSNIQKLLQLQQYREPIVHLPAVPPPNLAQGQPAAPQQATQAQISQYRPNVQYGQVPEQPTYRNQAAAIAAQYRPQSQAPQQAPQYRPQAPQAPQYNPQYAPRPQPAPQYNQQPQQPQQYNRAQYQG